MLPSLVPYLALLIAAADHPPATPPVVVEPVVVDRPVTGYWQPGGYEGRIGSPYFYSVPAVGYQFAGHHGFGGCGCGRRHGAGWRHGGYSGHSRGYGWGAYDPYSYHFGPGYYRHAEHGHFRFPYYSYRRPWYHPGPPVFNRDTNFAW